MRQEVVSFNGYHQEVEIFLKDLIDEGYHIDSVIRTSDLTIGFNTYILVISKSINNHKV